MREPEGVLLQVVDTERGRALAAEYGIKFMETSAKSGLNVEEAFVSLAKDIKARLIDSAEQAKAADAGTGSSGVNLKQSQADKKAKGGGSCCGGGK